MVLSSDPLISSKSTHTKKKGFEVGKLVELDSEVGTLVGVSSSAMVSAMVGQWPVQWAVQWLVQWLVVMSIQWLFDAGLAASRLPTVAALGVA